MNSKFFLRALILAATSAVLPAIAAPDRDDPAAELASFTLAEGFEANLFASEVDGVIKPIQMRFDALGRLWVIGSSVYPQIEPGQEPDDKVLILEDTNDDGRCDKTTVFARGLMIPTGLETLADGSGCYLGHGTELLLLRDTDGDGRADHREVVLRGFGTGDNHQNINSFNWAPGGELWFCQGLHAHARVETPFGIVKLDQAGIWRLNPRTLRLEGFYGSAADPQNPWGFVFTDWGEALELAGNNSVIIYPTPGMVKRPKPAQPANLWPTGRGRKMSGGEIVGTAHFPNHWQGRLIVGGYLNNGVWTMTIHDDGAGFRVEDAEPLVTSSHSSFRPVDVRFGPEGALYLCDWYNPIIGHYQASFRHPDRDRKHGRIWRITAKGRPLTPKPTLASASLTTLTQALFSTDRWTRQFASRLLIAKPKAEVVPALSSESLFEIADGFDSLTTERRALAFKERWDILRAYDALTDNDIHLVQNGSQVSAAYLDSDLPSLLFQVPKSFQFPTTPFPEDRIASLLRSFVSSGPPRLTLHAIVATTYLDTPQAVEIAMIAADRPTDKFIDFALEQAVHSLKPRWLPALREGRLTFDHNQNRFARFIRADGTADTLQALRDLLRSPTLDAASRESFLAILAETGEPSDLTAIVELDDADLQARLLPGVTRAAQLRGVKPPGDLATTVRRLLGSPSTAIQEEAWRLIGAWRLQELQSVVLERAATSAAALTGLLALDPMAAAGVVAAELTRDTGPERAALVLPLFFRQAGAVESLAAAMAATPPAPASAAAARQVLSERGLGHPALAEILQRAAGPAPPGWTWSESFAHELAKDVQMHGQLDRGKEIYRRAELTCVACHAIGGEGGRLGPALDAVGAAQPIDFLVGAVLAPQKEIKEGFDAVQATTRSGEVVIGYRAPGAAGDLTLRDPATGTLHRLPRPAVAEEKSLGSLMPASLVNPLTRDELRDLIAYLATLGKTGQSPQPH